MSSKKINNFFLVITISAFFLNIQSYNETRNNLIKLNEENSYQFSKNLNKLNIDTGSDLIAIYNKNNGYGGAEEVAFYESNSIFASEKFSDELLNNLNYRYLRIDDILYDLHNSNQIKFSKIRYILDIYDNYISKKLSEKIYLILSPYSLRYTNIDYNHKLRNRNFFIKKDNEKIDYIIYNTNDTRFRNNNSLKNKFKNKIQLKMNIDNENISSFTINKDKWIVMKVNSDE